MPLYSLLICLETPLSFFQISQRKKLKPSFHGILWLRNLTIIMIVQCIYELVGIIVKFKVTLNKIRQEFNTPASHWQGGVAHMVERSLRMREARGSIPRTSILISFLQFFSYHFTWSTANGHDPRVLSIIIIITLCTPYQRLKIYHRQTHYEYADKKQASFSLPMCPLNLSFLIFKLRQKQKGKEF